VNGKLCPRRRDLLRIAREQSDAFALKKYPERLRGIPRTKYLQEENTGKAAVGVGF
jgi:hypothetical protein